MPGRNIFLNYRRDDTAGHAGRLFDRLHYRFPGRVFRDVTGIAYGADYYVEIERTLSSCGVMVVLIGKHWLTLKDEHDRPRLLDQNDLVRYEVATGLRRNAFVIPVLVGGARMPSAAELPDDLKPLTRRNALEITEPDFESDVARLIRAIEHALGEQPQRSEQTSQKKSHAGLFIGVGVAVLAVFGLIILMGIWAENTNNSPQPLVNPQRTGGANPGSSLAAVSATFHPVGRWTVTTPETAGRQPILNLNLMGNNTFAAEMLGPLEPGAPRSFAGQWQYSPESRVLGMFYFVAGMQQQHVIQNITPHGDHYDAYIEGIGNVNLLPQ